MAKNPKTIHANVETSTFPNLIGAPNQRRIITSITEKPNEVHEPPYARRDDIGVRVEAVEVTQSRAPTMPFFMVATVTRPWRAAEAKCGHRQHRGPYLYRTSAFT